MGDEIEMRRDRLERGASDLADTIPGEGEAARAPHEVTSTPVDTEPRAASTPGQRLSRRAKLRRALVAAGAVVLAVVVLAALLPNTGASLRAALGLPTPVPTATLPIGAGTFLIVDTVPWGTLLVDGHPPSLEVRQPNEPVGAGPPAPTFVLDRGRHTVEYRAAPFPTLRCVVSVPAARSDTCPLEQPSPNDPVQTFGAARVLDLQARPERVPTYALASLEQTLLVALNANIPTAQVAVGEHYLGTDGAAHVAAQPLVASLVYAVNQNAAQALPGDTGPCVALCRAYPGGYPVPNGSWRFAAHVVVAWRYTRLDGSVVLDSASAATPARDAHTLIEVDARWNGGWTLADRPPPGVCDVAYNMLTEHLSPPAANQQLSSYEWWSQFAAYPASGGCLMAGAQAVNADNQLVGPTAFVLYRFGVLLAANDLAHQLFPSLPAADAQERALARSLAPQSAQG